MHGFQLNDNMNTAAIIRMIETIIWALARQKPAPTKLDSNQSPQLQRLASNLKFQL